MNLSPGDTIVLFTWITIIVLAADCAAKLYLLALGESLERTAKQLSADVFINFVLIVFGAVALASIK